MRVTANDDPEEIVADVPKRFSSLIVELPVQQTGSGDPSPENIRPITQWTDVALYVADTDTATDPTVTTILPTPIFGGMVDVARGEVASLYNEKKSSSGWEMVEEGQFRCQVGAFNNGDETSTNVADLYSSHYKTVSNKDAYDATDDLTCGTPTIEGVTYLYVNDLDYTTLEDFTAYIGNVQFVYKSHVPMSDVIEPTIVYLPEGTSYVWADAGFVELTVQGTPPLSLPNSFGKPLTAWAVNLSPYQEGTGDPAPDNVRPIHGTDKVTVWTSGKNLIQNTAVSRTNADVTYTVNSDGTISLSGTASASSWLRFAITDPTSPLIKYLPAGQYHLSGGLSSSVTLYIVGFYRDGTPLTNANVTGGIYDRGSGVTFTLTQDAWLNYQMQVSNGTDTTGMVVRPMIERGTGTSEFEPYVGSSSVIPLPETIYSGQVYTGGAVESSEEIDLATIPQTRWRFGNPLSDGTGYYVYIVGTVSTPTTMISDRYVRVTSPSWETMSFGQFIATTYLVITVPNECSTLETARDYLINTNKPQFVVSLATPTTLTITTPSIPTPKGNASTWATAEDGTVDGMEVTYVAKQT